MMARFKYAAGMVSLALLLVAVFWASSGVAKVALGSWVNYKQPYKPDLPPVPLPEGVEPLGRHVVIVVIDGARPDLVEKADTPNIDWVRDGGVWFNNARCFTPSLSHPGYAAIGTGARPSVAGVTSNWQKLHGDIGIDSIFRIVQENGGITALAGSLGWMNLYGKWFSVSRTIENETLNMDSVIGGYAVSLIKQYKPQLLVVLLWDTDLAGHEYGAVSGEYRQQIEEADMEIGKIIEALDNSGILEETLLIITSDHGMLDKGHHGGWEEEVLQILLVMRGPYVKHMEVNEEVFQDEIAATVCFFLGHRLPTGLTGNILFDIFDVNDERKALYQISLTEIRSRQFQWFANQFNLKEEYENNISRLEKDLASARQLFLEGRYGDALIATERIEGAWENLIETVWGEKHSKEVSLRLQTTLLIYAATLISSILIVFILRKKIDWKIFPAVIFSAIGYLLGFWATFLARGWYFSISIFRHLEEFQGGTMVFTVTGLIVAGLATGLSAKWTLNRKNRWVKIILATLVGLILVVIVNTIYVSFYYVQWNYVLDWYFPEGRAWGDSVAYYLMLMQNAYLSIFSAISPAVALTTSTVIDKLSKKQRAQ